LCISRGTFWRAVRSIEYMSTEASPPTAALPDDPSLLKQIIAEQEAELAAARQHIERQHAELAAVQQRIETAAASGNSPGDLELCRAIIAQQQEQLATSQRKIEALEQRLHYLLRRLHRLCRRSAKGRAGGGFRPMPKSGGR